MKKVLAYTFVCMLLVFGSAYAQPWTFNSNFDIDIDMNQGDGDIWTDGQFAQDIDLQAGSIEIDGFGNVDANLPAFQDLPVGTEIEVNFGSLTFAADAYQVWGGSYGFGNPATSDNYAAVSAFHEIQAGAAGQAFAANQGYTIFEFDQEIDDDLPAFAQVELNREYGSSAEAVVDDFELGLGGIEIEGRIRGADADSAGFIQNYVTETIGGSYEQQVTTSNSVAWQAGSGSITETLWGYATVGNDIAQWNSYDAQVRREPYQQMYYESDIDQMTSTMYIDQEAGMILWAEGPPGSGSHALVDYEVEGTAVLGFAFAQEQTHAFGALNSQAGVEPGFSGYQMATGFVSQAQEVSGTINPEGVVVPGPVIPVLP